MIYKTKYKSRKVLRPYQSHEMLKKLDAVVKENSSQTEFDVSAQHVGAIQHLAGRIRKERIEARAGNVMIDQFAPWYFSIACAFISTYQAGMMDMPSFAKQHRYRRCDDAPRIEAADWVRATSRRVEASLYCDWMFGFLAWSYLFRFSVNLSHSVYAYERKDGKDLSEACTPASLELGAIEVAKALWGKYRCVSGSLREVNGNMTKFRYVPNLSEPAQILLKNIEHASRKLPGTQEARRAIRFQTQAFRIRYGTPLFITFSPDESLNLLMIRLSRKRRNDPIFKSSTAAAKKHLCGANAPRLRVGQDDVLLQVSAKELFDRLHDYDDRKNPS